MIKNNKYNKKFIKKYKKLYKFKLNIIFNKLLFFFYILIY